MLKTLRPLPQRYRLKCKSNLNIFRQRKEEEKRKRKKRQKKKTFKSRWKLWKPSRRQALLPCFASVGRCWVRKPEAHWHPAAAAGSAGPAAGLPSLEKLIPQGSLLSAPCSPWWGTARPKMCILQRFASPERIGLFKATRTARMTEEGVPVTVVLHIPWYA